MLGEHGFHMRLSREARGLEKELIVFPEIQILIANCTVLVDEVLVLKLIQIYGLFNSRVATPTILFCVHSSNVT